MLRTLRKVEWPTLILLVSCYAGWAACTTVISGLSVLAGVGLTGIAIALHSSLCHEVIHGHPFRSQKLNDLLVFPALTLVIPYGRFRETHLAHHQDAALTDPYDDPETNYLDPAVWRRLPFSLRRLLQFNNTLAGRLLIGPLVGLAVFIRSELRLARDGAPGVRMAWLLHLPQASVVILWLAKAGSIPAWAYLFSVWIGLSILKIRTFLEHQAHERPRARTVIVEDRGPLSWIFLNNNLHVVHHMHPRVPWYRLPDLYAENRERYRSRNAGYVYPSYRDIFRRHFRNAKDPVPHPLFRQQQD